jgi:N-glycosylase/DNA lyase
VADNLREDAAESCAYLCGHYPDSAAAVREVFAFSEGLHLLHQQAVETIIGYVLSVQSSVELVRRRLDALAELFPANRRLLAGSDVFLFPAVAELRSLTAAEFDRLHLGYRTTWLRELIAGLPEENALEELREEHPWERRRFFRTFAGIGPKVSSCIDLFVYGNDDAFPVDVWVDRGLRHVLRFSSREVHATVGDSSALGPHCGLFGEYLFRYERERSVRLDPSCGQPPAKPPRSADTG